MWTFRCRFISNRVAATFKGIMEKGVPDRQTSLCSLQFDNDRPQVFCKHYFIDESGDTKIFDSRGRVVIGTPGVSRFFTMGLLAVADHEKLALDLHTLRMDLLDAPRFKGVPSFRPEARKTALMFHAKDDLPEVRREVFKVLNAHDLKFFATIRDKHHVLKQVREKQAEDQNFRYKENDLYPCSDRVPAWPNP